MVGMMTSGLVPATRCRGQTSALSEAVANQTRIAPAAIT